MTQNLVTIPNFPKNSRRQVIHPTFFENRIIIPFAPSLNSCPIGLQSTFKSCINPFHATGPFQHPLKTTENRRFTDVFRGYWKRPVAWKGLTVLHVSYCFIHTSFVAFSIKHWSVAIIASFKASDASVKKLSDDTSFINNWDAV